MPVFEPESFSIRTMEAADLAAVVELERVCHITPWPERLFKDELSQAFSTIDLLWHGECLVGYICSWQVCDEVHILNVAVAPAWRRHGLARRLLEHVMLRARARGCERALLEVRAGNQGAVALYRAFDFEVIGHRSKYYADGEDALVMERALAPV
jgi:ribosomal-protein-alanine N-acetyltransferase